MKQSDHWVEMTYGLNIDTGFYEFSVRRVEKGSKPNYDLKRDDEKYFLIRPSPEGHLIAMVYDRNAHPTHTPQLQPQIFRTYHNPYQARRRLEKECHKYARELMKKWRSPLKTTEHGFRKLEDLEPLPGE